MKKNYYSMTQSGDIATINIYGDICSWAWEELGEMSAVNLSKKLDEIGEVSQINVYINSYGGEVAEGLAIYNALKRHKAKVKTYCDGFACSIASVIFMAGDERVMNESSLLMIHNAWMRTSGNAEELRKQADDLDKITQASVIAYMSHSSLSEEDIKSLMDNETWILPEEAAEWGFATSIEKTTNANASQNAKVCLFDIVKKHREGLNDNEQGNPKGQGGEGVKGQKNPDNTDPQPPSNDGGNPKITDDDKGKEAAQKLVGFFSTLSN